MSLPGRDPQNRSVLSVWLLVPLAVISFISFRAMRFMVPALPALYLIASRQVFIPPLARIKTACALILTGLFAWQYCLLNFYQRGDDAYRSSFISPGLLRVQNDSLVPVAEEVADYIAAKRGARRKTQPA